jgi:hypothetical protein
MSCAAALTLLVVAAPAAAQYVDPQTCSGTAACDSARRQKSDNDAAYEEAAKLRAQKREKAEQERRRALLKAPRLPAERNALLGSWRLDAGERSTVGGPGQGWSSRERAARELIGALSIAGLKEIACAASYSGDVSFTPSTYTYSVRGSAGSAGGPIAYRSAVLGGKPAIAAIPGDSRRS